MSERLQSSYEVEREAAKLARRAEQTGVTEASLGDFVVASVEDSQDLYPTLTPEEVRSENKAAWHRMLNKDREGRPLEDPVIGPDGNPLPEGRSVTDPREQDTTYDNNKNQPTIDIRQLTFDD